MTNAEFVTERRRRKLMLVCNETKSCMNRQLIPNPAIWSAQWPLLHWKRYPTHIVTLEPSRGLSGIIKTVSISQSVTFKEIWDVQSDSFQPELLKLNNWENRKRDWRTAWLLCKRRHRLHPSSKGNRMWQIQQNLKLFEIFYLHGISCSCYDKWKYGQYTHQMIYWPAGKRKLILQKTWISKVQAALWTNLCLIRGRQKSNLVFLTKNFSRKHQLE